MTDQGPVEDDHAATAQTGAPRGASMTAAQRWTTVVIAGAVVLLADQLTKAWALAQLAPPPEGEGRIIDVVGSLRFIYAENTGMAFSKGSESGRWIGLVVILVVAAMIFFASRVHSRVTLALLGVVIGGALGNLVDRASRATDGWLSGAVVDFIDLQWWPVFNIADAAVVVGGILLVFVATREPRDHPTAETASQRAPADPDMGE